MSMHFIEAAGWTSGFNENKGRIMMVLPSKESTTTSKSKLSFCCLRRRLSQRIT